MFLSLIDTFKGTGLRDFRPQVFFMNQLPQAPEYPVRAAGIFFRKFAEILAAQSAPPVSLTPVANGKNLRSKMLTYRYIFSFKFTLRCQQSHIVPISCHRRRCCRCHRHQWQTATGTGGKICRRCRGYSWCT
jgi:hypothetical protein